MRRLYTSPSFPHESFTAEDVRTLTGVSDAEVRT